MRRTIWIPLRRFWRKRRWHLAGALMALPFLAAMALSTAGAKEGEVRPWPPAGFTPVDMSPPARLEATPGCHIHGPPVLRRPLARRAAAPPTARIPFFARRTGKLPQDGAPVVAGIALPEGSRCGPFWSTDAGAGDAWTLAARLAAAFPQTGLWPVLWAWPSDEPDSYVVDRGSVKLADALDGGEVLRGLWKRLGPEPDMPFPGLAAAAPETARMRVDAFGEPSRQAALSPQPSGDWLLVLVPVNRPADVISVLRPAMTEYFGDHAMTAVLRSWEERFGAVLTTFAPGVIELAVAAPPDAADAGRLAAEHAAFAPEDENTDDLTALREQLRSHRVIPGYSSAHHWVFGWPD